MVYDRIHANTVVSKYFFSHNPVFEGFIFQIEDLLSGHHGSHI